ncbi:MAG: DNA polymerase III subunit gamma/tau, partial [Atopobiaceae bacterium]|nr:DNA polymerase III subunit gamma/tau [Atopobiaceae bacterium]
MESLYNKYRPQTFDQVVGQHHVVETLERAVREQRVSHAYLFCGPRGTGKTTMARLLAKALLCVQGRGHLPDGTCEECQLIAAGNHPDVLEIDAASNTGVDNVRDQIISRASYAPVRGSYKVYIIDEVHMLTPAAFNALLKTLEEPPEHVVFIMCTTDPQKILGTVLSRVQRFDFHAISDNDLQATLVQICAQEEISYEPAALELIARSARGGMRDALKTLEQLALYTSKNVTLDAARDMLGETDATTLGEVAQALARRDVPALFSQVASLVERGRDLLRFTLDLAAHLRDVYVVSVVGAAPGVLPAGADDPGFLSA